MKKKILAITPKAIIATTIRGLYIKSYPWKNAHVLWFKNVSKKLKDPSLNEWAPREDYFKGVDIAMKRLYPKLSDKERTVKARELFFDSVLQYIKENPDVKNKEVIDYFKSLKNKYNLAIITTNTDDFTKKVLKLIGLNNIFEIIETSETYEKDDKILVFKRFVKKYGKPKLYIGGERKDSFDYCIKNKIPCVLVNLEDYKYLDGIETLHNLKEIKAKVESIKKL